MEKFLTLQILTFLLPGFISAQISNALLIRKSKNNFEKVIEALIYSVFIYFLYTLLSSIFPLTSPISLKEDRGIFSYIFNIASFSIILAVSVILPIASILLRNSAMWVARWCKLTNKTSEDFVWIDVFRAKNNCYIIVNFTDGRRLRGWPQYYSDDHNEPYIYLYNPQWIDADNNYFPLNEEDGVLITPKYEISHIEFLKEENPDENGNEKKHE